MIVLSDVLSVFQNKPKPRVKMQMRQHVARTTAGDFGRSSACWDNLSHNWAGMLNVGLL